MGKMCQECRCHNFSFASPEGLLDELELVASMTASFKMRYRPPLFWQSKVMVKPWMLLRTQRSVVFPELMLRARLKVTFGGKTTEFKTTSSFNS